MDSSFVSLMTFVIFLAILVSTVSARVCVLGTEPDPTDGRVKFVLTPPGDPCTCQEVRMGGHNTQAPPRPTPPSYIDMCSLRSLDADGIRRYFYCVETSQESTSAVDTTAKVDTTVSDPTTEVDTTLPAKYVDCQEIMDAGHGTSGVYTIYHNDHSIEVYCRMVADQGYIVFQRRLNGSVDFNRTWQEYADGFGSLHGEFWLGNEMLKQMTDTNDEKWELVITLEAFNDKKAKVRYNEFSVTGSEYALDVKHFNVEAGDKIRHSLRKKHFSTWDVGTTSGSQELNCAEELGGGWWFNKCNPLKSNLNGVYHSHNQSVEGYQGIRWVSWEEEHDMKSLKGCEMMMMRRTPSQ